MELILLEGPELDAYGQMALDEALMSWVPPKSVLLRSYRWLKWPAELARSGPPWAATFGYMQTYEAVVQEIKNRGLPVAFPVVRRPTGGGVVIHDQDITFSVVFPWGRLSAASWVYKDLHRAIHLGLKSRGLASRLWSSGKSSAASCFPRPAPMDLVHENGDKFLGGALRRRFGVGLYQGSLRPEGFKSQKEFLWEAVLEGVELNWKGILKARKPDEDLLKEAARLRDKYFADDWNKRR